MFVSIVVIILFIVFTASVFLGSFFGVVVDRVVRAEQFLKGKSYCETCKHRLGVKDLIPLLSFVFSQGKCRYCKSSIPFHLILIELTTGIIFTLIAYYYLLLHLNVVLLVFLYLVSILLILMFFTDLKYYVIPDVYLYGLLGVFIVYALLYRYTNITLGVYGSILFSNIPSHLISAGWLFLFFAFLHFAFKKRAMGEGDIYLATILGLFLEWQFSIVMWFISFLTGATVGVILVINGSKGLKREIPFGPFLILGFIVASLYGGDLITWYLSLL